MINLRMSSFTYGHIRPEPTIVPSLLSLTVPGSEAVSAEGDYGRVLLQQIDAGEITILYNIYQVTEDIAIDFRCDETRLRAHIALKNDSQYNVTGLGELYLADGQYTILDAPNVTGTYYMEHGKEYRTMHIFFSSKIIERLLPVFHYFREWWMSGDVTPRLLFNTHSWLTQQQRAIIDSILNGEFTGKDSNFYREAKAYELICQSLKPTGVIDNPDTVEAKMTRRHLQQVQQSKHAIDNAYHEHISIAGLAQEFGIHHSRLRTAFRKVFGMSISDYLLSRRMQAAQDLLKGTNKPLKEIATLTGYASKQSFVNAFKRFFHNTPGKYRKN